MPVKQGVDIDEFQEFVDWLDENPKQATLDLEATARYEGVAGRSLAKVDRFALGGETIQRDTREYTFPFGAWKEVEDEAGLVGPTDRIEPVETALASLASCINVAVSVNALKEGIELEDFETTVRTSVDPSVLFGVRPVEEAESCLRTVEVEIRVDGDVDEEELERLETLAERSPVHTLVSSANSILTDVRRA